MIPSTVKGYTYPNHHHLFMYTLNISSLPMEQVLADLAEALNTNVIQLCNCYTVELPERVGTGYIQGVQFPFGFALLNYRCRFHRDTAIRFTFDQVHPMKFLHCFEGSFDHYFEKKEKVHRAEQYQNMGVASKRTQGHILHFKAQVPTGICSVEMDRNKFQEKVVCLSGAESGLLTEMLLDVNGRREFYRKGNYSVQVSGIIQSIMSVEFRDIASALYLEGKSYEILSLYWQQFSEVLRAKLDYPNLSRIEYGHLQEMLAYIQENLPTPLTLEKIENDLGFSEKYVQSLFKKAFGTTYGRYLKDFRLRKSVELLDTSNLNISEIVYSIGLNNRSYFTRIFKDKFGITPSDYKADR